jgi:uncharacterized damage-inducible protein DinB
MSTPTETETARPYSEWTTAELIAAFEAGPRKLREAISGLSETELRAHPRPGKWSIKQVVVHLVDAELMASARIRQAYAEPGSTFSFYNQDIWTDVLGYQELDAAAFENAVRLFEALRLTTAPIFRAAHDDDWSKAGYHPEHGNMTLHDLLRTYAVHSERHIEQIHESRALLGKPL